jgi:hypothetical protein
MLIALTGPQGGGKSTIVENLADEGYPIITRKTARSILGEWGVTLHDVNNDVNLSLKFQEEIISRKHSDEIEAVNDKDKVWFIERSFVDVFTYTLVNFGKNNEYNTWLNNYYDRCSEFQKSYAAVIYIPGGLFPIRDDGVRGINQHYGKMIDLIMKEYVHKMTNAENIYNLTKVSISDRINEMHLIIDTVKHNENHYPHLG